MRLHKDIRFRIGTRVKLSKLYLDSLHWSRVDQEIKRGVITGRSSRYPSSVRVVWDGLTTAEAISLHSLEIAEETC